MSFTSQLCEERMYVDKIICVDSTMDVLLVHINFMRKSRLLNPFASRP